MFHVVQLDSDVLKEKIVVPPVWLDKSNTLCLLPPTSNVTEIENLAKIKASPKHGWKMHSISSIKSFDTYSQAEENINKKKKNKPVTVDLAEVVEEGTTKRKRKRPSFLRNYSTETGDDEERNERSLRTKQICFVEGNLSHLDASIVKVEVVDDFSSSSSSIRQRQEATDNTSPSTSSENNLIVTENSLFNARSVNVPINTKCPCNSACHKLIFQSIASLHKQMEDSNRKLWQIMARLTTSGPVLDTLTVPPLSFPVTMPIKELNELKRFNNFLGNQQNFTESIPYFTELGGNKPRQVLKRILDALLSEDLSAKLNWKGRGDKHPFHIYSKVHSFVYHVAKQNPKATQITKIEVENFMKDWLKTAPMRLSKSREKRDVQEEESILQC